MKKMKVSMLALAVMAGGVLAASAATVTTYIPYGLNVNYTNAGAAVWEVSGAPGTTGTAFPQVFPQAAVQTDDSGKITGTGWMDIEYNTNNAPFTPLVVSITGKIGNKTAGSAPTVTLAIKGSGYTADGKGGAVLTSAALKFTGTVGTNPDTNSAQKQIVIGTLSGTIKGATPLDPKSAKVTFASSVAASSSNFANLGGDVLQAMKGGVPSSMLVFSPWVTGKGTIKSGTTTGGSYTLKFTGIGMTKGLSGTSIGSLGFYTNNIGTNPFVFLAPTSATLTGKDKGQAISGTGPQSIFVNLIW